MSEAEGSGSAVLTRLYKKRPDIYPFGEYPVVVSDFLSKEKSQHFATGKILTFLKYGYEMVCMGDAK
ncbi:hypothetical protein J9303_04965 [Bacillaceae bacterium Marseille-Q3522]|nr:hypothetical protein [Bacillaceae bacterium Marseille-Q3522]